MATFRRPPVQRTPMGPPPMAPRQPPGLPPRPPSGSRQPAAPPPPPAGQPLPPPPSAPDSSRRRAILAFVRRWTIPLIGGIVPVGLIVINIAVWINDHLSMERWVIAVAAFLSGMILNSWWALQVYRWLQQRWPHWGMFHQRNMEMALVGGMTIVIAYSVASAVACFYGLGDTKNLPNAFTLWWGIIQIATPVIGKIYFEFAERKAVRRTRHDEASYVASGAARSWRRGTGGTLPPPSQAPPPPSGYVPPSYLPPS